MLMAHPQAGAAEFRCRSPASRFRLPAGQLGRIVSKTLILHSLLLSRRSFSGKIHVSSLTAGKPDSEARQGQAISARGREQAGAGRGIEDRLGIDAVSPVKISDVAGLSKAVDAQRDDRVAGDRAEPR